MPWFHGDCCDFTQSLEGDDLQNARKPTDVGIQIRVHAACFDIQASPRLVHQCSIDTTRGRFQRAFRQA